MVKYSSPSLFESLHSFRPCGDLSPKAHDPTSDLSSEG